MISVLFYSIIILSVVFFFVAYLTFFLLFHFKHNCCGRDSPQDYLPDKQQTLPSSCCRWGDCAEDDNILARGCVDAVTSFFNDQSDNLVLIIVGLIAFQVRIFSLYIFEKKMWSFFLQVLGVVSAYYFTQSMVNHKQKREQIIINE